MTRATAPTSADRSTQQRKHTTQRQCPNTPTPRNGTSTRDPGTGIDTYDLASNRFSDIVVLADGDFVVLQHAMTSTTLGGKPSTNVYCFVFRFNEGGKIVYLTEHWNTWHAYQVPFNNFPVEPAHPLA